MPIYQYLCEVDGVHDLFLKGFNKPETHECPTCHCEVSNTVTSPARIEIKRDWNDTASDMQRDPYTQAKAQLTNIDRQDQLRHDKPAMKITEEAIQVAAKQIDNANKGFNRPESIVKQQIKAKKKKVKEAQLS